MRHLKISDCSVAAYTCNTFNTLHRNWGKHNLIWCYICTPYGEKWHQYAQTYLVWRSLELDMSPSASHGANDLLLSHSCGLNKLNVICVSPEVAMPIQYELRRLFHLMNIFNFMILGAYFNR